MLPITPGGQIGVRSRLANRGSSGNPRRRIALCAARRPAANSLRRLATALLTIFISSTSGTRSSVTLQTSPSACKGNKWRNNGSIVDESDASPRTASAKAPVWLDILSVSYTHGLGVARRTDCPPRGLAAILRFRHQATNRESTNHFCCLAGFMVFCCERSSNNQRSREALLILQVLPTLNPGITPRWTKR